MDDTKSVELARVAEEVRNLSASTLAEYRKEHNYSMVFGEGNIHASIMLIGEAPGENEARAGRPFVGAAGRILSELLQSIGLQREDIYITNVVKDRPPKNRDPNPEEIDLYAPYLIRQIEIIRPQVIATLGRFALDFVLQYFHMPQYGKKIGGLHGKRLEASTAYGKVTIVPLYHPAASFYNPEVKASLREDFQVLKQFT